jgi:Flp pilus assembly protein TadG
MMSRLGNYGAAVRGSVAVIFGITAAVVFGAAGMAVDFINASSVRTSLQQALDSAVLAAASAQVKNEHQAEEIITEFMASNWTEKYPTIDPDVKQSLADDVVTGTASVVIPTLITGLLGIESMEIAVTSSAKISSPTIEVAMVIDNSSSMNTHLKQLQKALTTVVETLAPNGTDPDVTFALVPYSTYVNVGLSNKNKSWLSFAEAEKSKWDGCVGSRDYPLDLDDSDNTAIPAVSGITCNPTEMLPLTSDVDTITDWIDDLTAEVNDTYTGAGLIWGYRALSEREPLTEAKPYGDSQKVIIFLTDAISTMGPSYPKHDNENDTASEVWQTQCTNIKAAGITLYTIAFQTGTTQEAQLTSCATSSSHAFTADNSSELKNAFADIAAKLAPIYLSE